MVDTEHDVSEDEPMEEEVVDSLEGDVARTVRAGRPSRGKSSVPVWNYPRDVHYQGTGSSVASTGYSHSFCLYHLPPPLCLALTNNTEAGARVAFAQRCVEDALSDALGLEGDAAMARLLRMLRCAVDSRDASATSVIWMRVDEHLAARGINEGDSAERPYLGLQEIQFTHALLQWLLFHVRQPKLLLCMINDRDWYLQARGNRLEVWDWRPHKDDQNPSDEAEGMVAAVMDAVLSLKKRICDGVGDFAKDQAKRNANMGTLPSGACDYWHKLLPKLYAILPRHPEGLRLRLTDGPDSEWQTYDAAKNGCMSLLELAVRCSEESCSPLTSILKHCTFTPRETCDAFHAAIRPGVLRCCDTAARVADVLIRSLGSMCATPTADVLTSWDNMWLAVVDNATQMKDYAMTSTRSGVISVPKPKRVGEHHPDMFLHIVDTLGDALEAEQLGWRLDHVLKHMTTAGRVCTHQTYLIEAILRLWHRKIERPWYLKIPHIVPRLMEFHPRAFDIVEPHITTQRQDGTRVAKVEYAQLLVEALHKLINGKHRDSTRRVMCLFDALPLEAATYEYLHAYVFNLVKRLHANTWLGQDMLRMYNQHMKEDFVLFLKLGQFSDELLKKALTVASRRESTIAVEVLTSPPYNVVHDAADTFACHVVEAMLTPGEQVVVDRGREFDETVKRQKVQGEGGEGEGEEGALP